MVTVVRKSKVVRDNTGNYVFFPVIFVDSNKVLASHINYLLIHEQRSHSWRTKSAQSISLLLEYNAANEGVFATPQKMFEAFASALHIGTIDKNGIDPSGLRWNKRSVKTANVLIKHVTHYSEYLHKESGGRSQLLNKIKEASRHEKLMLQAAYQYKYENAFLKHTMRQPSAVDRYHIHNISNRRDPFALNKQRKAKHFPEEHIRKLLDYGFIRRGSLPSDPIYKRLNLHYVLITILQHYGGLRMSECFHIYTDDIYFKEIMFKGRKKFQWYVDVPHPQDGFSPDLDLKNRKEYLAKKFGLEDRISSIKKSYHAGWKFPALNPEKKAMRVHFYPQSVEQQFHDIWFLYIKYQRFEDDLNPHPFAFCSKSGAPLSIKAYEQAHKAAVERIGLISAKNLGTTPHGHRHAYGQRLQDTGVDQQVIQRCLHHRNPNSQLVYTIPSEEKINEILSQTIYGKSPLLSE